MAIDINIPKPVIDYNDLENLPTLVTKHSELTLDDGTNPHGTTATDVGLGNVPNLDTTDAVNKAHDAVTLTGTTNYLTIVGQAITRGLIDLASHVTNRLGFSNLPTGTARSIVGRAGSGNGDVGNISAGNNTILGRNGSGDVAFNSATETKQILSLENFRKQDAGGAVTAGVNILIGDTNNAVASDIGTATIGGGGTVGRENIIGGNVTNVNTNIPNTVVTGTQADYSVITGGYDNVASGLMSVISGAHNYTKKESTHGTIGGGSVNKIDSGDYNTITGGTANTIDTPSGSACTISGRDNIISGNISRSTIAGGGSNQITGSQSTILGGLSNTVSSTRGSICGGASNTVSGTGATVVGGESNYSEGDYSIALGVQAKARLQGQKAHSAGRFSSIGDAQGSTYILRRQTTTNAGFQLRVDGGAGYLTIPDDTTWAFSGLIVARRSDSDNESAGYKIEGCIDHNAGTVALVGTPIITILGEDITAWNVTITADNSNKVLAINVFGENSKTIRWVCKLDVAEVTA